MLWRLFLALPLSLGILRMLGTPVPHSILEEVCIERCRNELAAFVLDAFRATSEDTDDGRAIRFEAKLHGTGYGGLPVGNRLGGDVFGCGVCHCAADVFHLLVARIVLREDETVCELSRNCRKLEAPLRRLDRKSVV